MSAVEVNVKEYRVFDGEMTARNNPSATNL